MDEKEIKQFCAFNSLHPILPKTDLLKNFCHKNGKTKEPSSLSCNNIIK